MFFSYAKCRPLNRCDKDGRKDVIYTSHDEFTVENDNFLHDFFQGTHYYIEYEGTRYKANSYETVSLTDWTTLDIDFMETEFDLKLEEKAEYSSLESILQESIGGELDFKNELEEEKLYLMNGVVYNRNEAGNFMWAYFIKDHGHSSYLPGILAQAGSLVGSLRLDESHDRAARYAGLHYWYKRHGKEWVFYLKYGQNHRL